jgi:hypothetical protein
LKPEDLNHEKDDVSRDLQPEGRCEPKSRWSLLLITVTGTSKLRAIQNKKGANVASAAANQYFNLPARESR